jgi:electron transport complex protein RnfE
MAEVKKDKKLTTETVTEVITEKEHELDQPKESSIKLAFNDFKNGLFVENPLLVLMIGLCSALAVSNKVENTIFMGVAATFVLVMSNVIIASIKKLTPQQIRIPIFIVVIASFVTIVDLTMRGYFPAAYERLGVWIPLIVVNCIILGRAEAFAYKNSVFRSMGDGFGMGAGYTIVLVTTGFIREILGTGKLELFGMKIAPFGAGFAKTPALFFALFPGSFLVFGLLIGLHNVLSEKYFKKEEH